MATESTPPTELDRAYSKAFKEFTSEIVDLVTIVNKARTNLENSQKDDGSFSKQGPIKDLEDAAEALERKIENIGCHGANPSLRRKVGRLHLRIRAVEVEFVRQPPGKGRIKAVIVKGLIGKANAGEGENYSSQSSSARP